MFLVHRAIERKPRALLCAEFVTGLFWVTSLILIAVFLSRVSWASCVPLQAGHPPEPRSPCGHGEPGQASPLPGAEQRSWNLVQAVRIWDGRQRFPSSPCITCLCWRASGTWICACLDFLYFVLHPFKTRLTCACLSIFGECLERQRGLRQCWLPRTVPKLPGRTHCCLWLGDALMRSQRFLDGTSKLLAWLLPCSELLHR